MCEKKECALLLEYSRNGIIESGDMKRAERDYEAKKITFDNLLFVAEGYKAGAINNICPSCWVDPKTKSEQDILYTIVIFFVIVIFIWLFLLKKG